MSADLIDFPRRSHSDGDANGPTGPLMDKIGDEYHQLSELLPSYPFGSEYDPAARVSSRTLVETGIVWRIEW